MSESTPPVSPSFVAGLRRMLDRWLERTRQLTDEQIALLEHETGNLEQVVRFGLVLPETQTAVRAVLMQAFPWLERSDHAQVWLPYLARLVTSLELSLSPETVMMLNRYGFLLSRANALDKAVEAHQRALTIAQQLNDPETHAATQFYLSEDYRRSGEFTRARENGEAALAVLEEGEVAHNVRWPASILNTLGLIAYETGDYKQSRAWLERSVALWRELDEPTETARALNSLGIACQALGEYDLAIDHFKAALAILEPTVSELDKCRVRISLSHLYFERGDLDEAEAMLQQADTPALARSGDADLQGRQGQNLGNILWRKGSLEAARHYLCRAIDSWQLIGHDVMLANSQGTLAAVEADLGNVEQALSAFNDALTLLHRHPDDALSRRLVRTFTEHRDAIARQLEKA